jgi:hypothetical protein
VGDIIQGEKKEHVIATSEQVANDLKILRKLRQKEKELDM